MIRTRCPDIVVCVLLGVILAACGSTSPPTAAPTAPVVALPTATPAPTLAPAQPTQAAATPTLPATPTVVPTPTGPQAAVIDVVNEVDAHPLPEEDWVPAQTDMTIYLNGEVWAKEASTARVGLNSDGFGESIIRVAPNTIFTYGQPDAGTLRLQLDEGQMWIDVEGLEPGKTFEIETPDGIASVRGTRFSVRVVPGSGTVVSTREGAVSLTAAGATTVITAGNESRITPGGAAPHAVPVSIEEQLRWGMATAGDLDVVLPMVGEVITFTYKGGASSPVLSPDGRYFTFFHYLRKDHETFSGPVLYDTGSGKVVEDSGLQPSDEGVSFSPQGDMVAFVRRSDGPDQMCTAEVGAWKRVSCFSDAEVYGWPRWSPDGQWLTFYARAGSTADTWNLYRVRVDGTDMAPLTSGDDTDKFDPALSPDGAWVAYSAARVGDYEAPGTVWVARSDGSDARQVFEGSYAHHGLVWSPDGSVLLIRGYAGGLYLYNAALGAVEPLTGTEGVHCSGATWSPSGHGWPLFFSAYSIESRANLGLHYSWGQTPPQPLAGVGWGPVWSAGGSRAVFGLLDSTGAVPTTTFYIADIEPGFYP